MKLVIFFVKLNLITLLKFCNQLDKQLPKNVLTQGLIGGYMTWFMNFIPNGLLPPVNKTKL